MPPSAQTAIETDEDLERILPEITNWGRWGQEDELGTLNYITPDHRRSAARLVHSGRSVSLARETSLTTTEGVRRGQHEVERSADGSRDYVGMVFHGFAMTHLDALCHAFASEARMYNGFPVEAVTPQGATRLGVEVVAREGICGRGVLLDVAGVRGSPLEPGTPIHPADLEAAEEDHDLHVSEGDILLVRTGAGARNTRERRSGLHPACLPWLHARRVALLGGDGDNDVHPAGFERWASAMHAVGIPYLGLPLLDNADLDPLAGACREERRWVFLLMIAPFKIRGATGAPVNPLALL